LSAKVMAQMEMEKRVALSLQESTLRAEWEREKEEEKEQWSREREREWHTERERERQQWEKERASLVLKYTEIQERDALREAEVLTLQSKLRETQSKLSEVERERETACTQAQTLAQQSTEHVSILQEELNTVAQTASERVEQVVVLREKNEDLMDQIDRLRGREREGRVRLITRPIPTGVDLRGFSLCDMDLSGAYFEGARMESTDLSNSILRGACLSGASGVTCAMLRSIRDMDLTGVDLSGLNLSLFDLSNMNMRGCNMSGCDLSRTNFDGTVLADACLEGAILPDLEVLHRVKLSPGHVSFVPAGKDIQRHSAGTGAKNKKQTVKTHLVIPATEGISWTLNSNYNCWVYLGWQKNSTEALLKGVHGVVQCTRIGRTVTLKSPFRTFRRDCEPGKPLKIEIRAIGEVLITLDHMQEEPV
ncbi:hypothetical protein KIPB_004625, partial [Kipferlia bialata]